MNIREKARVTNDLPSEKVDVPEWGCAVYIRTVGAVERDMFEEASLVKKGKMRETSIRNIRARMVVLTACNEDGTPAFIPADTEWLGSKSAKVLDRLYSVAARLNGWSDADIEELEKNLTNAGSSTSGSPDTSAVPSASS